MFRIEPQTADFLTSRPERLVCNIPPCENRVELTNIEYLNVTESFVIRHYNYKCAIVAKGQYYYHDLFKGTMILEYNMVKTSISGHPFYFLMLESEQDEYMVREKEALVCA